MKSFLYVAKKYFFIVFLSFLLCSCMEQKLTSPVIQDALALSFLLKVDAPRQKALLNSVRTINDSFTNTPKLVNGAIFILNGDSLNAVSDSLAIMKCSLFPTNPDSCYNYYIDSLDFSILDSCMVSVYVNDVPLVGKAYVPGPFKVSYAARKLSWSKSKNASIYKITISRQLPYFNSIITTEQNSLVLNRNEFEKGKYSIIVDAFEKNADEYLSGRSFKSGIVGAYGFFGIVRSEQTEIYIKD